MPILTTQEAFSRGITPKQLAGPTYQRLFHGVYVDSVTQVDLQVLTKAAAKILPRHAVFTGMTALRLRGLDFGQDLPLYVTNVERVRRSGIVVVPGTLPHTGTASIPAALRSLKLNTYELIPIVDRLRHLHLLQQWEAEDLANDPSLVGAWFLSSPLPESIRESQVRALILAARLPSPSCQVTIHARNGDWLGRVDMAWEEFKTIAEYEGQQHRTDDAQWNKDIMRYDRMIAEGWDVVRITNKMLRHPDAVVRRICQGLQAGGYGGALPRLDAHILKLAV